MSERTKKGKTAFVWVMILLIGYEVITNLLRFIYLIGDWQPPLIKDYMIPFSIVSYILIVIIDSILLYKLIKITKDLIRWVHISFVTVIIIWISNFVIIMLYNKDKFVFNSNVISGLFKMIVIPIIMLCILWFYFVRHPNKAKKEKRMVFQ